MTVYHGQLCDGGIGIYVFMDICLCWRHRTAFLSCAGLALSAAAASSVLHARTRRHYRRQAGRRSVRYQ